MLAGTIAFTDRVAHEWFAPAGLNRGGLTNVTEAQTRLTQKEMSCMKQGLIQSHHFLDKVYVYGDRKPYKVVHQHLTESM